jgi:hypothetical protein
VGLRGQWADHEAVGDLDIAEAARDETEDFAFTVGQLGDRLGRIGWVAAGGELSAW